MNRAEAVKIVVAPLIPSQRLTATESPFLYVPEGAWFLPYVESGRTELQVLTGPPERQYFEPSRHVQYVEFLKMLLAAHGVQVHQSYSAIRHPFSFDVHDPDQWYYPYIRSGLSSSLVGVDPEGNILPHRSLSRADVAILLHQFLQYLEGNRHEQLVNGAYFEMLNAYSAYSVMKRQESVDRMSRASMMLLGAQLGASADEQAQLRSLASIALLFRSLYMQTDPTLIEPEAKNAWHRIDALSTDNPELQKIADYMKGRVEILAEDARNEMNGTFQ